MSGGCDTVMLQPFQTCTGTGAMCAAGSECVQGTSSAVCLVTCTRDDNCAMLASQTTGTPVCRLQLQSGLSACIVQCDPNLTMCPGNTTCQQDSQLGAYFCLP